MDYVFNLAAQSSCASYETPHGCKSIEDSLRELEGFIQMERMILSPKIEEKSGHDHHVSFNNYNYITSAPSISTRHFPISSGSTTSLDMSMSTLATEMTVQGIESVKYHEDEIHRGYRIIVPRFFEVPEESKFFVIKSFNVENIKISYKEGVWSSTELGNRRLSKTYNSLTPGARIYLLFSVNGSGRFCGIAEMRSDVSYDSVGRSDIWTQKQRYKGIFYIRWWFVKDVPNKALKHFLIPGNEMKPVTNSRDTQEIPIEIGRSVIKIFKNYNKTWSSFLEVAGEVASDEY